MIAEAGLAALWLAAGLAGLQLLLTVMALRSPVEVGRTIRSVAVVQGTLTLIAFAMDFGLRTLRARFFPWAETAK